MFGPIKKYILINNFNIDHFKCINDCFKNQSNQIMAPSAMVFAMICIAGLYSVTRDVPRNACHLQVMISYHL